MKENKAGVAAMPLNPAGILTDLKLYTSNEHLGTFIYDNVCAIVIGRCQSKYNKFLSARCPLISYIACKKSGEKMK